MLRRRQHLTGTKLLRVCSRLVGSQITGKTAIARARVLDTSGIEERLPEWLAEEAEKRGIKIDEHTIGRLVELASKPPAGYSRPKRTDLAVVLCHFNPAGWQRPPRLLYETCESVVAAGITPVVAQLVLPGRSPSPLPAGVRQIVYQSDSVLFHKENLWNLTARETSEDKILFLDGDIYFSRRDIFDAVSECLDTHDIIQPFSAACWLAKDGGVELVREPAVMAVAAGEQPVLGKYHPGFAWALTRKAFDDIGGFFERHPLGGGDAAIAFSLTPGEPRLPKTDNHAFAMSEPYKAYRDRVLSLNLKIGWVDGSVYHLWHGDRKDRGYEERYKFLPPHNNGEYPLRNRPDGLLEWDSPECNAKALAYFARRMEDG